MLSTASWAASSFHSCCLSTVIASAHRAMPNRVLPQRYLGGAKSVTQKVSLHVSLQFLVRVQSVSQPVPQKVHAQDRDEDEEAGEPHQPRRQSGELTALVQQVAPRRGGRLHAEPEEGKAGLGDDRAGHEQPARYHEWTDRVREHVP